MYNKQSTIVSINREVSVKLPAIKFHMPPFFPFLLIALTKDSSEVMWIQEPNPLQGNKQYLPHERVSKMAALALKTSYEATHKVKRNGHIPDNSLLNGVLSQIIPAPYIQRHVFSVLWRTEQNIDFITVSMFLQNSVKLPPVETTSRP